MDLTILLNSLFLLGLLFQLMNLRGWQRATAGLSTAILFILFWLLHPSRVPLLTRSFLILNFLSVLVLAYLIGQQLQKGNSPQEGSQSARWRFVMVLTVISLVLVSNLLKDGYRIWEIETKLLSADLTTIAPQIVERTYPVIGNWGSNGRCRYEIKQVNKERITTFVEIEFQVWGNEQRDGAGWLLMPQPFFDAGRNHHLDFSIRGKHGGEKVGLSVKDIRGNEVPLEQDIGWFCETQKIQTNWQRCRIPLSKFQNVDMEGIEAITLYVDRSVLRKGTDPQHIFLADLRFR